MKPYKIGMYGGKFMPLHKGHYHCLEVAAEECETVYFICFINGIQEQSIIAKENKEEYSLRSRLIQMYRAAEMLKNKCSNILVRIIDVAGCITPEGTEDWEAETPLVRTVCGPQIDAVYGSEESYGKYFKEAYPEAEYRLVDKDRVVEPISATMIRNMKDEEKKKWII